jgi:hypothetical protein
MEPNTFDTGRRAAEEGDLIERWDLGRHAQGAEGGPAGRTGSAATTDFECNIYRAGPSLAKPTFLAAKVQALMSAHDRGIRRG